MAEPPRKGGPAWAVHFYGRRRYVPMLILCVLAAAYVAATTSTSWIRIVAVTLATWFAYDAWRYWTRPIPGSWIGDDDR